MKRKSFLTVFICLLSAMIFAGCGASADSNAADKPENVKEETEKEEDESKDKEKAQKKKKKKKEKKQEETAVDEADYKAVYAPVFDEVFEVLDYGFNIDKEYKYVSGGLSEKVMYSGDDDLLNSIGYQMTDLSGDGVPELLIGSDEEYDGSKTSYIYILCTVKDDKPALTVTGSTRSSYNYMGDGHLYYQGSGGASITLFGENHLSSDGSEIVWDDFYFSDEKENGKIGIYYNKTGIFDAKDAEELDISEAEFSDKMSSYQAGCKEIPWTPIGQYRDNKADNEANNEETIPEYFIYVISPDGYANLRTGPGTEYDVICRIPTGDSMEVYRETATDKKGKKWLKVAYWHPEGTSQGDGSDDQGVWETGWIAESQVE